MMKDAVVIKGNKAGMTVYLEKDLDFEEVLQAIAKKFKATAKFWGSAQMTLTLEGRDLTPEEEFEVVKKEIKQTKETMDLAPADRTDIIDQCKVRLAVLSEFAPEEMSEDAIRAVIREVIAGLGIENPTGRDKGKIMKELMPKVKGKADGSLVNKLVGELLA